MGEVDVPEIGFVGLRAAKEGGWGGERRRTICAGSSVR